MEAFAQKKAANDYYCTIGTRVDLSKAWSCPWQELETYPITPTNFVKDDLWEIPPEWCATFRRRHSKRIIDFSKSIPKGTDVRIAEGLIRRLKRLAILDRFHAVRINNRILSPSTPSTLASNTKLLIKTARYIFQTYSPDSKTSRCPDGPDLFAILTPSEFETLKSSNHTWATSHVQRLNGLFSNDYFDDWPSADVAPNKFKKREDSKAACHFSDEAFTQILRAALWLNSIQLDVLHAYIQLKDIDSTANGGRRRALMVEYRRQSTQSWASTTLQPGTAFPFDVKVVGENNQMVRYSSWPLDTVRALKTLLFRCQTANSILILASTGMRIGELVALTTNALVYRGGQYYLTGHTYKTTDVPSGQSRQWPFPLAAVEAFKAQAELSKALGGNGNLWVNFGGKRNTIEAPDLGAALRIFGKTVAVSNGPDLESFDCAITPHRFRYSLARYVALSLTGATQILFDVLGHKDVETTLGYALADSELAEDINTIVREVKANHVKEVFDNAEHNGGLAAEMVGRIKRDILVRSGKEELDTDDIAEAAAILGEVEMVRPGVLCTAQRLERGACSPTPGVRDVGACTSSCLHHLELGAHRQTRRKKLENLLQLIEGADRGTRVFYQGQIIANFDPFPDLIDEYATDPRLRTALSDCDPRSWVALQEHARCRIDQLMGTMQ